MLGISVISELQIPKLNECIKIRKYTNSDHFWRVLEIAESDYWLRHVCPSVCPYGTTGLQLDRFHDT